MPNGWRCPPTRANFFTSAAVATPCSGRSQAIVASSVPTDRSRVHRCRQTRLTAATARAEMASGDSPGGRVVSAADGAGVMGAIVAALCCAGTPVIVGALAALGLGFLRRDAILWPLMLLSLAVALWGFWQGFRLHRQAGPLTLGVVGALSLACGVIIVHGPPAMTMIYGGGPSPLPSDLCGGVCRSAGRAHRLSHT